MGDETHRISRDAAVWAVAFSKSVLVVTDWNDTLSFYNTQGQQILKDRNIGKELLLFTIKSKYNICKKTEASFSIAKNLPNKSSNFGAFSI